MIINAQKQLELKFLMLRLENLSAHINKHKKDHGAKIALNKVVYKIKAVKQYLKTLELKINKKGLNTQKVN